MGADYSRVHRLLKILALIQGGKGWTPRRLALECGTAERTIYRDLQVLEAAGIPCFFDEETKGYRVRGDFFMPPLQLTLEESLALSALADQIGGKEQIPFTKAAARGLAKIRGQLPGEIRQELDAAENRLMIQLSAANPPEAAADVYERVRSAMAHRHALLCEYDSRPVDSQPRAGETFLFKPYALLFCQRAWYAVGHHQVRGEVRCLKLNRFTKLEMTNEPYDVPADFSLQGHLGNAWRMIRGAETHLVELWFDPAFADTIADTHWHATQEVIWNDDQSITFRCTVDGLDEIVWWVLSMGPHCTVRKPLALAERVRNLAIRVVANYSD